MKQTGIIFISSLLFIIKFGFPANFTYGSTFKIIQNLITFHHSLPLCWSKLPFCFPWIFAIACCFCLCCLSLDYQLHTQGDLLKSKSSGFSLLIKALWWFSIHSAKTKLLTLICAIPGGINGFPVSLTLNPTALPFSHWALWHSVNTCTWPLLSLLPVFFCQNGNSMRLLCFLLCRIPGLEL